MWESTSKVLCTQWGDSHCHPPPHPLSVRETPGQVPSTFWASVFPPANRACGQDGLSVNPNPSFHHQPEPCHCRPEAEMVSLSDLPVTSDPQQLSGPPPLTSDLSPKHWVQSGEWSQEGRHSPCFSGDQAIITDVAPWQAEGNPEPATPDSHPENCPHCGFILWIYFLGLLISFVLRRT